MMESFTTSPHAAHEFILLDDAEKVDNRIYELRSCDDASLRVPILGSELRSLLKWFHEVESGRGVFTPMVDASSNGHPGLALSSLPEAAAAAPKLCLEVLADDVFEGSCGEMDFHVRREEDRWVADVFRRRIVDLDLAYVETLEAESFEECLRAAHDFILEISVSKDGPTG